MKWNNMDDVYFYFLYFAKQNRRTLLIVRSKTKLYGKDSTTTNVIVLDVLILSKGEYDSYERGKTTSQFYFAP